MKPPGIALLLLLHSGLAGQAANALDSLAQGMLASAPFQMAYDYSISADEFQQAISGTLYVAAAAVFRLDMFDKVYGSDGSSLYLHDRNTRQTIIDSLRMDELFIWLRLLAGHPPEDVLVGRLTGEDRGQRLAISHTGALWSGELLLDAASGAIRQVQIIEVNGWRHSIDFQPRRPWLSQTREQWVRLEDLPGERLDLR